MVPSCSVHSELLLPNTACLNLNSSYILKAFAASLIDGFPPGPPSKKVTKHRLDWACHSRLYCRKSQRGKRMESDQRTITLGTMIFGAVFKQLLNRTILHLNILGSWYWTDWTHNHKTLKEIIESHVCRAHYPSPRIFSTEISWQIFRKAEDPCYAQQRCMGYSCKNHGRRVASGNLIIPKRWSRRLWFATLMTHIERIFFFWNTLKLTEPETWWVGSWKHFIFWGRYNLINGCKLVLVLVG